MHETPEVTQHPIAFLRTFGKHHEHQKGYVLCPRQCGSVPLAQCARCPRFVKVTAGESDGRENVHCLASVSAPDETAAPLQLPRVAVSDLMARNVICARPDLTLDAVTALFLETSLAALPVVDDEGHLLGFLGQDEVTLAVHVRASSAGPVLTVADVLLPFAVAVPEATSVAQAAAVMVFESQHRLAVTSSEGVIVGVLSASDILYWLARADGLALPPPRCSCRP